MQSTSRCAVCGSPVPAELQRGACPVCLINETLGLSPDRDGTAVAEHPGDFVGNYRLLESIGEGGYGTVYRAEQIEPIRRTVALKVIKLGMDTRQVIARFEMERQALALMDHPGIARVIDAGSTDAGRPFFVMELVEGRRINDLCDAEELSTRQRIELFMQVCEAVQHAHQKGVIHRDLKPSNILVIKQGNKLTPKVIDFGIAKAIHEPLGDYSSLTAAQQSLGTPLYMSPEQTGLLDLDVDTRSDIYSLGVVLYQLLTGKPPLGNGQLPKGDFEGFKRTICETDPPKPSARLGMLAPGDLTKIAIGHRTDPPRLMQEVRGDLDWIVMKCLEKDRARRYESAASLARDLERHLNYEVVAARPPDRWYRARKFARRHRKGITTAVVILILVVLGAVGSLWQAVRAKQAEHHARTVARFLENMLDGVRPSRALGRDTVMLRDILDRTATNLEKELKAQPLVEAELRSTIGGVYFDLGAYTNAEAMHRKALELRRQKLGERDALVADSLDSLGKALYGQSKLTNAETIQRQALVMRERLFGRKHVKVAESLNALGNILRELDRLHEAEDVFREALALRRELLGENCDETAESLDNLGSLLSLEEKFGEAEPLQRKALALTQQLLGSDHPEVATSLNNLADTLCAEGKFEEAEATNRVVLTMRRKLFGEEHPDVAFSLCNLAGVLFREEKLGEAEQYHREALAMRRKLLGNEHLQVASSLNNLVLVLIPEGKLEEAEAAQREALAIQRAKLGAEHRDIAGSMQNLATILQRRGQLAESESLQREVLPMLRKLLGDDHPDVAASLGALADVLHDQHKFTEAEDFLHQEFALRQKSLTNTVAPPPALLESLADVSFRLTRTLLAQGKFVESEAVAREWLGLCQKHLADSWQSFNARRLLGDSLLGQKKLVESEPLLITANEGLTHRQKDIPTEYKFILKESLESLVRLYTLSNRAAEAGDCERKLAALQQDQTPVRAP